MDELLALGSGFGPLDWLAMLTSLAYVVLAARDNDWCWAFAAVSTAVWAYQSFAVYALVSDGLLQVFYFVMAGVGLWRWRRCRADGRGKDSPRPTAGIRRMTGAEHLTVLAVGAAAGGLLYGLVSTNFTAAATLPDALTTAFSVITTFLLVYRRLENWLYWVVIDLAYVWIYGKTGAYLFALMMVINVGVAIYGYRHWRTELDAANTARTTQV